MSQSKQPFLLVQFKPAWAEQAFMRFAGIEHCVDNSRFPFSTAAGNFPQLQSCGVIVPQEEIIRHLSSIEGGIWDLDSRCGLTTSEKAYVIGFESLVRSELALALEWSCWGDLKVCIFLISSK